MASLKKKNDIQTFWGITSICNFMVNFDTFHSACTPFMLVAAGFPSGQTPLETKLAEIRLAVEYGAREIDIVISRSLVLTGQWEGK